MPNYSSRDRKSISDSSTGKGPGSRKSSGAMQNKLYSDMVADDKPNYALVKPTGRWIGYFKDSAMTKVNRIYRIHDNGL